jgi:hypothetical protein
MLLKVSKDDLFTELGSGEMGRDEMAMQEAGYKCAWPMLLLR